MKDNDFRQLVDREFAPLIWTDEQHFAALRRMNKEEHPIMKRKALTALVLILSIVVMSAAALAVTVGIPGIQDLLDQHRGHVPQEAQHLFAPFTVEGAAVVIPDNQRHTSDLVDIAIREAYMTNEALYLTVHIAPRNGNAVLWNQGVPPIEDGKELRYFDLYRQEDLPLLEFVSMSLHSPYSVDSYALHVDYIEYHRLPDDDGVTCLMVYQLPKDDVLPLSKCTVMGKFAVQDCRTRKLEFNVLMFDLPRMTVVESTDDFLHN